MVSEPDCAGDDATQQTPCTQANAADAEVSSSQQSDKLLRAVHMQHTASAASHVAQLITSFVQSQPEAGSLLGKHAGMDSLVTLLQCYAMCAETAARPLCAPVWPPQAQLQRQQHAMLEHVAQAGMQRVALLDVACMTVPNCEALHSFKDMSDIGLLQQYCSRHEYFCLYNSAAAAHARCPWVDLRPYQG